MIALHKINLTLFRNYDALRLEPQGAKTVLLTGPNGSGKTNILEAISLLIPGKGLRGHHLADIRNRHAEPNESWAVAAELDDAHGERIRLGTGETRNKKSDGATSARIVRVNGKDAKRVSDLAKHLSAVWLTPQMDRLFLEGASSRRRFFDRLVFAFAPDHAATLTRYERHMRDRLRLLKGDTRPDPLWLDKLEAHMAADAVAIVAARLDLTDRLEQVIARHRKDDMFPIPTIVAEGDVEDRLRHHAAVDIEDELQRKWKETRGLDAHAGKTLLGPHRSDMRVTYADKDMPASQCSTGEQKGLLISILLTHARVMQNEKGHVPLLLLDDVAAHLDDQRRAALFARLQDLKAQVWMSSADADVFAGIAPDAAHFNVTPGTHGPEVKTA